MNHFGDWDGDADAVMNRIDAIRRADNPGQTDQRMYAAQCRAMFNGHQWIERLGVSDGSKFVNRIDEQYQRNGGGSVWTTVNQITEHIVRTRALTNPSRLEITGSSAASGADPERKAWGDILKAAANAGIRHSRILNAASRASFERQIAGIHGLGFRMIRNGNGGFGLEPFHFDGHQLSLDPENGSMDLMDHKNIVYTEPVTWDHAVSMFGEDVFAQAGITKDSLPTMGQIMPVEVEFHRLSGGRMYHHYAQHSKAPALVLSWAYHKDSSDRFDRLYVMADTSQRSGATNVLRAGNGPTRRRVLLNPENPENPYGGSGLNIGQLHAWPRTGSRYPVSDVGLMIDHQRKVNIAATIHFQGLWNFINALLVVDQSMLSGSSNMTPDDIWDQVEQGMLMLDRSGGRGGVQPYYTQTPQPSPVAANDMDYFANKVRGASMQSPTHVGETKTHVSAEAVRESSELSQLPLDDRQNSDIAVYENILGCMASTIVGLADAGDESMIGLLRDEGLSDQQLSGLRSVPKDRMPVRLKLARDGVVRRSRSRRFQELQYLQSTGSVSPEMIRMLMSELDMPVSDADKESEQYAVEAVARVVRGEEIDNVPMRQMFPYFEREIVSAMMSHNADPEIVERLMQALDDQLDMERAYQARTQPAEQGEGGSQAQDAAPDPLAGLPGQVPLSQLVGVGAQ